jgi:putative ABC transport system permease protein
MIKQELISTFRSILRKKVISAISILGLGIGLGCIIVLLALVIHEKSFDTFIPEHKNVYRIISGTNSQVHYPIAESMKNEFPEVKDYFRYYQSGSVQLKTQDNEVVREADFGFADPSVFRIMGIDFISGTPAASMSEVAISEKSATLYFGNLSAPGEVIEVRFPEGFLKLTVSGVYREIPSNSTLHPELIADIKLSQKMLGQFQRDLGDYGTSETQPLGWRDNEFLSLLVLDGNADPEALPAKMEKYKELIASPAQDTLRFNLQPVADIYLGSEDITGSFFLRRGNADELKYYEIISLMILLISLANFVLLARAGISERTRELGTRKVYGASHGKIRRMVILESFVIVLLSLIPAIFVIESGIPFINNTLGKTLSGQVFLTPRLWIMLVMLILLTGLVSGWIIGLRYSRIPALQLISGRISGLNGSKKWNYSFLLLHFTIYMILVTGLIAVSKQLDYSRSGYTGINPENVIVADLSSDELRNSYLTLCDELRKIPGVINVAGGSFIPPFGNFLPVNLADVSGARIRFDGLIMGEGMTELLGIEVIDGSSFGPYKEGPPEVLINESAAKVHNVNAGGNLLAFKVRGVVRDFHAHSLHTTIQPMVILPQNPARMGLLAIRTDGVNDEKIIKQFRDLYSQISPDEIFEVRYLTDQVENFYARERDQSRIIKAFSLLALVLSIMGLFGISLISIAKREKEIGIRKVNGASEAEVLLMLNAAYIKWVLVAIAVSVPVSFRLISQWMERFAYRTEISWWIFVLAGLSAIIISLLTVSWQSWRAATRNPVEALRYE